MGKFCEADTEEFYNGEDSFYRSFWDPDGSLHWGYFDDLGQSGHQAFLAASMRWNEFMAQAAHIDSDSIVLDVGCGNGTTAIWLAETFGCSVFGIDLSEVRIANANEKAKEHPNLSLQFRKVSAASLPFEDESFTHVWSQATLYHVHDRESALKEIWRVLVDRGTFLFDDLVQPLMDVSLETKKIVFDRLLFDGTFSHETYQERLGEIGFLVLNSTDLSSHLHRNYSILGREIQERYPGLSNVYEGMCRAIDSHELGWSFFHCIKVQDRVKWVYDGTTQDTLEEKYDAWAGQYDLELESTYRMCPTTAAKVLGDSMSDRESRILDAGAGTGMAGEELAKLGFTNLTAADISKGMLQRARQKEVYRELCLWNIEDTPGWEDESFDGIISVGVFTFSHANPKALRNLYRLLKPGGTFVVTVRVDYHDSDGAFKEVLYSFQWKEISREEFMIFENEPMYVITLRKESNCL